MRRSAKPFKLPPAFIILIVFPPPYYCYYVNIWSSGGGSKLICKADKAWHSLRVIRYTKYMYIVKPSPSVICFLLCLNTRTGYHHILLHKTHKHLCYFIYWFCAPDPFIPVTEMLRFSSCVKRSVAFVTCFFILKLKLCFR